MRPGDVRLAPNITGGIDDIHTGISVKVWGSFVWTGQGNQVQNAINTGSARYGNFGMWGNNASTIYGNSSTVQPSAIKILIIIKV